MATALVVVAHDSVKELRAILSRSRDEGYRKRIRAIIRIKEGALHGAVAKDLGASRTSICTWITNYNEGGVCALTSNYGGRPEGNPKWDADVFKDLTKAIDKGGYWSIPKMQTWLIKHKKKDIPEQTVWYRMNQLKYSYKSARPSPVEGSTDMQEAFKKGASYRSWSL
jgi:transposase